MVAAIRTIRASGLRVAALTNNWDSDDAFSTQVAAIGSEFDLVLESWRVGHRKPEQRIYELLLERLELPAPALLFLDDLGSNLKPARAMGMTTIHVKDITSALRELSAALGRPL
jgi:epoxide hydrolase-like predicted phosphatase